MTLREMACVHGAIARQELVFPEQHRDLLLVELLEMEQIHRFQLDALREFTRRSEQTHFSGEFAVSHSNFPSCSETFLSSNDACLLPSTGFVHR